MYVAFDLLTLCKVQNICLEWSSSKPTPVSSLRLISNPLLQFKKFYKEKSKKTRTVLNVNQATCRDCGARNQRAI